MKGQPYQLGRFSHRVYMRKISPLAGAGFRKTSTVYWSPHLSFKLGEPGSILGWTSTQGRKRIEDKELPLH
jgi:hypothetical protein